MENIQYQAIRYRFPPKPVTQSTGRYPSVTGLKRAYSYYQSDQQRLPLRPFSSAYHQKGTPSQSIRSSVKQDLDITVEEVEENELDIVYRDVPKRAMEITRGKESRSMTLSVPVRTSIAQLPTPELTPDRSRTTAPAPTLPDPTAPHMITPSDMTSAVAVLTPSAAPHPSTPPTPVTPTQPHKSRNLERRLVETTQQRASKLDSSPFPIRSRLKPKNSRPRPPPKCALRYVPGKGFGVVATVDIMKGETIVVEKPFLRVPIDVQNADEDGLLLPLWDRLGDKAKIQVLSFMAKRDDHNTEALARGDRGVALNDLIHDIVHNNGIPLETDPNEEPEETGMFETIGRVNHSCTPNSVWRWSKAAKRLSLVAYIDIPKDGETTASYLDDVCLSSDKRQADLHKVFAFACRCSACARSTAEIEASDKRLARYKSLERKWDLPGDSWLYEDWISDYPRAMRVLREAKGILESEGKYHAIGDLLEEIWIVQVSHGKKKEAIAAGKEMQEHYAISRGREDAGGEWDDTVINPELCANWREAVIWDGGSPKGRLSRRKRA